jgi:hypothetical protein
MSLATTVCPPIAPARLIQPHPAACELLGDEGVALGGDRHLTPGFLDGQAEDAELFHLLDQLLGVGVVVLEVAHDRPDLAIDELAHRGDDETFLGAELGHCDLVLGPWRADMRADRDLEI